MQTTAIKFFLCRWAWMTLLMGVSSGAFGWTLSTITSVGYGVEAPFDRTQPFGGSLFQLDVRAKAKDVFVGFRTSGSGISGDGHQTYRLAAGPLVGYAVSHAFSLHASLAFYQETGETKGRNQIFTAKGRQFTVGWDRTTSIVKGVSWVWGGFWSTYQGAVNRDSIAAAVFPFRIRSEGTQRGVHMGVYIDLP